MATSRTRMLGPLGRRLFAAFALVGVGAVGLVAALAAVSVTSQTGALVTSERDRARQEIVAALADAYAAGGSWSAVDLSAVRALAQANGARLIVLDTAGGQIATITATPETEHSPGTGPGHGESPEEQRSRIGPSSSAGHHGGPGAAAPAVPSPSPARGSSDVQYAAMAVTPSPSPTPSAAAPATTQAVPVVVGGKNVGSVLIEFPAADQAAAAQAGRAILQHVGIGAAVAVVLAGVAALIATRRATSPLLALAAAAGAVERGESDAATRLRGGPGEIGQVSAAFARMAATLEREDALRRALVADVAHELRTPVTILLGTSEQLLDGLAEPTAAQLSSLHDEVLRLDRLLDDLAALAAAQAAGLTLTPAATDLAHIAARCERTLRPRFDEAGLRLVTELRPAPAEGDEDRLVQVITNLLTNALKFTPAGGTVTIATRMRTDPQEASGAQLTVTDTGPGIPADELPFVFQRFWRGSGAEKRGGTGIGLAVVAELVAAHGGTVTAESPPGGGAVFTVDLPGR